MLLLTIIVIIISQLNWIDAYSFGLTRYIYIALVSAIYVIISLVRYLKRYCYLYYSDDKNQLEIRYYHSVLIGRNYKVVRIPFSELYNYELKESMLRKTLYLFQRRPNGKVAKYEGISVSAVEEKDLKMILANIDSYIK